MAEEASDSSGLNADATQQPAERAARRRIPGSLPYTTSAGVLRQALQKIPISEKPQVFNTDFVNTVLGLTGGAARPIVPILKSAGLLSQSGTPTDLYSQFQTESGRAAAALQALKNGFAELFKRNQYAHRADENSLTDLIVAVTGLARNDPIVRSIRGTFQVFQELARSARDEQTQESVEVTPPLAERNPFETDVRHPLGLTYNINIVLPESTNIEVYNAIFRSLRGNLLS